MAAGVATLALGHRRRLRRDNKRMRILADLAGVANGGETAEQIARAIADLLVPRLADVCAIDMLLATRPPRPPLADDAEIAYVRTPAAAADQVDDIARPRHPAHRRGRAVRAVRHTATRLPPCWAAV